jgi:hypothetical protein
MDFLIFVIPVVIIVAVLYICKKYNFSILPEELKGKSPIKFKMPKISRKEVKNSYKWSASDGESSEDDDNYHRNNYDDYEKYKKSKNIKTERNMYN